MTAPQGYIPPAANVLATFGTILWCIQLVPQLWHNWRKKNTEGLPGSMMFVWALCSPPFGVYAIVQKFAIAIQIQPQCFGVLALIIWGQTLYYHNKWSKIKATMAVIITCIVFGGLEVLLVFTISIPYRNGNEAGVVAVGIIAAILLAVGCLLPYKEIWKRKGRVIGINFLFLSMDWSGAFLSLLALVFQETFDPLGGSLYIVVIVLEAGIFISHWVWLLRKWLAKRRGVEFTDGIEPSDEAVESDAKTETRSEEGEAVIAPKDLEAGSAA